MLSITLCLQSLTSQTVLKLYAWSVIDPTLIDGFIFDRGCTIENVFSYFLAIGGKRMPIRVQKR